MSKVRMSSVLLLAVAVLWVVSTASAAPSQPAGETSTEMAPSGARTGAETAQPQAAVPVAKARDLVGIKVMSPNNEHFGKIEDLVIDPASGQIRYAVLSFGGFLGMGNKLFAVPWESLKLVSKGTTRAGTVKEDHYVLEVNKQALRNAPGFSKTQWPNFADQNWSAEVDRFYSTQRAGAPSSTRTR